MQGEMGARREKWRSRDIVTQQNEKTNSNERTKQLNRAGAQALSISVYGTCSVRKHVMVRRK